MKPIIFFLLSILAISLDAQTDFQKNKDYHDGFCISVGYSHSSFLNPLFSKSLSDKEIRRSGGFNLGTQYIRLPLLIDAFLFTSSFKTDILPKDVFGGETQIYHRGLEVAASVSLIHSIKYFIPYAGIGYQTANLETPSITEDSGNINKKESKVNVSSPIGKIGVLIRPYKNLGLKAEYKRSLSLDNNVTAFNQIDVSIVFRFDLAKFLEK